MSKITKLSAQKRFHNRVNIEVDGEFVTGLSLEEVVKAGLKVGQEVSSVMLQQWKELDNQGKVLGKVINFLSYRPRTTREVTLRLKTYTDDENTREYVINYLTSNSLLDDHSFATWWVKARNANHSTRVLIEELKQKGITRDIIESVLPNSSSDKTALIKLMQKKAGSEKAKLFRHCLNKGYSYELITEVFREVTNK